MHATNASHVKGIHEIQPCQPSNDALDFSARPSTSLGGTSCNSTERCRLNPEKRTHYPAPAQDLSVTVSPPSYNTWIVHTDYINIKTKGVVSAKSVGMLRESNLKYTGVSPTRFLIRSMMAATPWSSMSSLVMKWNPTDSSFSISPMS